MPTRSSKKRPRDLNQLAKFIVDATTADEESSTEKATPESTPEKNPAAVALGRLGGKKGGLARAAKLSPEERKQIAKKAARARWDKPPQGD